MTTQHTNAPGVYVGPDPAAPLVDAVRAGGGRLAAADDADAIVWFNGSADDLRSILTPRHRWVQLPSAGVEAWLDAGVVDRERVFTSAAAAYGASIAEHALALMLGGARNLHRYAIEQTWTALPTSSLRGSHVLLVGAGNIASALVRYLAPLDVSITAVRRSSQPLAGVDEVITLADLHDALPAADFVVLCAALTEATYQLVGAAELAAMAPHAFLVNVGRGALVDTDALVAELKRDGIAGAGLDVTDPEPLPDGHPLWADRRVLISPHVANPSGRMVADYASLVEANVGRFVGGRPLEGAIEVDRGY